MTSVYERLKNLQITLPGVPPPVVDGYVAAFVPFVRTGNLIHLSGRLAKKNGKLWCGKLGEEITTAEGKQAARSVAIELLATLQAAIGDLNDVRRIVKLLVFVNSGPHFTEAHMVANGASELFIEVFEERGAHTPKNRFCKFGKQKQTWVPAPHCERTRIAQNKTEGSHAPAGSL